MKKTLLIAVIVFAFLSVGLNITGPSSKASSDCSTLTFITESLPTFFVGVPANYQLEASGGTPPYKFKITDGVLPPELDLSKDGLITGVPTMAADTTIFVRLQDHRGCSTTRAFAVRVEQP
ncbi:MAG: putative Ig domain-containing protein [Acidobacteriota bacterium]